MRRCVRSKTEQIVCVFSHLAYVQLPAGRNGKRVTIKPEQKRLMIRVQFLGAMLLYHTKNLFLIGTVNKDGMANVRHNAVKLMGKCLALPNLRDIQNCPLNVKQVNRPAARIDIGIADPSADVYIPVLCNIAHVSGACPDVPVRIGM